MQKRKMELRRHCLGLLFCGFAAAVLADDSHNVDFIGYHPLQGRQALQITTKSDTANGNWAYIGHVPNSDWNTFD